MKYFKNFHRILIIFMKKFYESFCFKNNKILLYNNSWDLRSQNWHLRKCQSYSIKDSSCELNGETAYLVF